MISRYFLLILLLILCLHCSCVMAGRLITAKNAWEIPEFNLAGLDGKNHQLSEWKGKVILLNFWASWCAPCLHEIKYFTHYQEKLRPYNFQVVSIGLDDKQKLDQLRLSLGINYPILFANAEEESTQEILAQWGNEKAYIPYSVIIRADGNIHYTRQGLLDEGSFKKYVLPLLSN